MIVSGCFEEFLDEQNAVEDRHELEVTAMGLGDCGVQEAAFSVTNASAEVVT